MNGRKRWVKLQRGGSSGIYKRNKRKKFEGFIQVMNECTLRRARGTSMKFAAAYEQSRDAVYGYLVYMTRDVSLAEDLSQEVFLRMFLHLGKFREESSVRTWALSIARNVFLTYAKRKRPVLLEEQDWEPAPDLNSNQPEEEALKKEQAQEVRRCLMCLGEQERTVLLLRDFQELSYEEIAKIMGLKAEVVKSRIYRSRQKFREIYKRAGE